MSSDTGARYAPAVPDFEPIALAFLAEREQRRGNTLQRYVTRYPRYARELTALAFETAAAERQELAAAAPGVDLLAMLREDARAALMPEAATTLTSLLARGREHAGLSPRALAQRLAIGVDVLALLEERHIRPDTIVAPLLAWVAEAVGASIGAVQSYLSAPPAPAARGVAYHAPRGHRPARMLTFAEAIAASNLMTPEQKAHWLAYASDTSDAQRADE